MIEFKIILEYKVNEIHSKTFYIKEHIFIQ